MSNRTARPASRAAQRRRERAARTLQARRWAAKLNGDGWTRTLSIDDVAALLDVSTHSIRRRLKLGTFPIPPINIAQAYGWWGPSVKAYLDSKASAQPSDGDPK